MDIKFNPIGTIHTPYLPSLPTPNQPPKDASGEFWLTINPDFIKGIEDLKSFRYIYVIYYLDQVNDPPQMYVSPPWANGSRVSLFASRSAHRPNPIGLSIVEVKGIEENDILISAIDAYNNTPILDIKPYMHALDIKLDANNGWMEDREDYDHILAHFKGTPHHHDHEHGQHDHNNVHDGHEHKHEHKHKHEHQHEQHESSDQSHQCQCHGTGSKHGHGHKHGDEGCCGKGHHK